MSRLHVLTINLIPSGIFPEQMTTLIQQIADVTRTTDFIRDKKLAARAPELAVIFYAEHWAKDFKPSVVSDLQQLICRLPKDCPKLLIAVRPLDPIPAEAREWTAEVFTVPDFDHHRITVAAWIIDQVRLQNARLQNISHSELDLHYS